MIYKMLSPSKTNNLEATDFFEAGQFLATVNQLFLIAIENSDSFFKWF